jgi:hypothetical protein
MELLTDGTPDPTQPSEGSGARRLAVALLEQAFHDLRTGSSLNRSDARCWIQEGDVGEFTFNFCCEVIDWNPERIRAQVLKDIPVPTRFKNRISAANKGWLARERAADRARQSLEAAV